MGLQITGADSMSTFQRPRLSFWLKAGAAVGLVAIADLAGFLYGQGAGLALFLTAWVLASLALRPAVFREARAMIAGLLALLLGLLQVESQTLLGGILACTALAVAALSARAGARDDAWRWAQRLLHLAFVGLVGPGLDLIKLMGKRARGARGRARIGWISLLALPLIGGAVFLSLFLAANPILAEALGALRRPDGFRLLTWAVFGILVWTTLRPRFQRRPIFGEHWRMKDGPIAGVSVASVTLSLVVFNLMFAVQNGLDLAFLWSGATLPKGVTLADYAHRGAYPLIATALLAGLFVLVALRPGSQTARTPLIRWLVVLWAAQNLLLVASSILRTVDYIEVYSLTRFRIAALIWMALVGVGLVLICWRMLRGRSASWLINANALAAGLVLIACAGIDLGSVAAAWNVRHAREVGGQGAALDVCYLSGLGAASAVSLARLEREPLPEDLRDRVSAVRLHIAKRMTGSQSDWRRWSWRDARRLEAMRAVLGGDPAAGVIDVAIGCGPPPQVMSEPFGDRSVPDASGDLPPDAPISPPASTVPLTSAPQSQ